jgi:cyclopropane-fatty-acyl-phospholipid synthase
MNSTTAKLSPTVAVPRGIKSMGIYQSLVLRRLREMTLGRLDLELLDGTQITIGEPDAKIAANIQIIRPEFFKRCVLFGDIGFGEAYVDGDWQTDDIAKVISWFILNIDHSPAMSGSRAKQLLVNLLGWQNRLRHSLNWNSLTSSRRNISFHYDLGNEFYQLFLDPTMTYSSALFTGQTQSLEEAQIAKYDRLCRLLKLTAGQHVLEIGGGWGGFSLYAAKNYGCKITSVTISREQHKLANERVQKENLSNQVQIKLQDYRLLEGMFDKIVSIEMLEAVGDRNLETYFAKCHQLLKPHGLLGLQMITCPDSRHHALRQNVDWIQKHIFPGSLLLSIHRINQALRRTGDLFLHDLKDIGLSYAETLKRWRTAFNQNEAAVRALPFDTRFIRKWNYYLSYCEAAFAMRNISVVQAIYTRPNNPTLQRS